jgi:hypothetical protein
MSTQIDPVHLQVVSLADWITSAHVDLLVTGSRAWSHFYETDRSVWSLTDVQYEALTVAHAGPVAQQAQDFLPVQIFDP